MNSWQTKGVESSTSDARRKRQKLEARFGKTHDADQGAGRNTEAAETVAARQGTRWTTMSDGLESDANDQRFDQIMFQQSKLSSPSVIAAIHRDQVGSPALCGTSFLKVAGKNMSTARQFCLRTCGAIGKLSDDGL